MNHEGSNHEGFNPETNPVAIHKGAGDHEKASHYAHVAQVHALNATHHVEEAAKHHADEHGVAQEGLILFGDRALL